MMSHQDLAEKAFDSFVVNHPQEGLPVHKRASFIDYFLYSFLAMALIVAVGIFFTTVDQMVLLAFIALLSVVKGVKSFMIIMAVVSVLTAIGTAMSLILLYNIIPEYLSKIFDSDFFYTPWFWFLYSFSILASYIIPLMVCRKLDRKIGLLTNGG